jgi:hypothetical protein
MHGSSVPWNSLPPCHMSAVSPCCCFQIELALQLEALYKRSLHKLALDLARACVADAATIASIQQRSVVAAALSGAVVVVVVVCLCTSGTLSTVLESTAPLLPVTSLPPSLSQVG